MLKFLSFLKSNESGLEKLVGLIAMVYPLTAIPQVAKIWYYKETAGVSLLSWSLFLAFTVPLLLYVIVKKDKRLTLMWSLWALTYVSIIIGLIIHG